MGVSESVRVICAKRSLLHSLHVPIKTFTNSLAVLNQQTLRRNYHVLCFQTQLTEKCLVVEIWAYKRPVCCEHVANTSEHEHVANTCAQTTI